MKISELKPMEGAGTPLCPHVVTKDDKELIAMFVHKKDAELFMRWHDLEPTHGDVKRVGTTF